jgi:bifunctional non-homologous end joining protein LigD
MVASVASKLRRAAKGLAAVEGARRARPPGFIPFCDPASTDIAPSGPEWVYEIKSDGYRAQAHLTPDGVTVYSRNGYDWTEQFAGIASALRDIGRTAIIDGEAVVIGSKGIADYQALRRELGKKDGSRITYHAFDLLYLDGYDLRVQRKGLLIKLLETTNPSVSFVDYIEEAAGEKVFSHACALGVEGIVCKRKDSRYRSGRVESWLKRKCTKSDDFPIVAFVEKLDARPRRIASLYLGRHEGDRLVYAGKAQSGYTLTMAQEVREALDPLVVRKSPLSVPVKKPKATWVQPLMRAEVHYNGTTDDGLLREAVFKGLREDLVPPKVKAPRLVPARDSNRRGGVPKENILQLLPDAVPPSRPALVDYWTRVWKRALSYLGNRPLKLVRHTRGTTFYHKGPLPPVPDSVYRLRVQKRDGGEGTRLWVDSLDGLLGLVSIGVVELHPWNATVDDIERADTLVIDLDPGEGVEWERVVDAAMGMRAILKREGLACWPKLTGGKGIHLVAPLKERVAHDRAHEWARHLVGELAERDSRHLHPLGTSKPARTYLSRLSPQRAGNHSHRNLFTARARRISDRCPQEPHRCSAW